MTKGSLVKSAEQIARRPSSLGEQTWIDLQHYKARKVRRRALTAIAVVAIGLLAVGSVVVLASLLAKGL